MFLAFEIVDFGDLIAMSQSGLTIWKLDTVDVVLVTGDLTTLSRDVITNPAEHQR